MHRSLTCGLCETPHLVDQLQNLCVKCGKPLLAGYDLDAAKTQAFLDGKAKGKRIRGVDFLVVRELTGGLYFGARGRKGSGEDEQAFDTMIYSKSEVRRVVKLAFQLAKGRRGLVTSIDKANVLESSRLWRQVAVEVGKEFPAIKLEHQLVDSAAMRSRSPHE